LNILHAKTDLLIMLVLSSEMYQHCKYNVVLMRNNKMKRCYTGRTWPCPTLAHCYPQCPGI